MGELIFGLIELVLTCLVECDVTWSSPSQEEPIPREPIYGESCKKPAERP